MTNLIQNNVIALFLFFPFSNMCSDIGQTIIKLSKKEARVVFIEKIDAPKSPNRERLVYSGETNKFGWISAESSIGELPHDIRFVGSSVIHTSPPAGRHVYIAIYDKGLQRLKKLQEKDIAESKTQIAVFIDDAKPKIFVQVDPTASCSLSEILTRENASNRYALLALTADTLKQLQQLQHAGTVRTFVKDPCLDEPDANT